MGERERRAIVRLGDAPEKLLVRELSRSFLKFTGLIDGRVAVIVGVKTSVLSDEAYVWLFGSTLIKERPIVFLRHARRGLKLITPYFKRITGLCADDHIASMKWLRSLGFEIEPQGDGVSLIRLEI